MFAYVVYGLILDQCPASPSARTISYTPTHLICDIGLDSYLLGESQNACGISQDLSADEYDVAHSPLKRILCYRTRRDFSDCSDKQIRCAVGAVLLLYCIGKRCLITQRRDAFNCTVIKHDSLRRM